MAKNTCQGADFGGSMLVISFLLVARPDINLTLAFCFVERICFLKLQVLAAVSPQEQISQ
jgi:hypothetical protein